MAIQAAERPRVRLFVWVILAIVAGLLFGQAIYVGLGAPRARAEDELVAFTLDFILRNEIGGTVEYIRTSGQPWVDAAPRANIIIYGPLVTPEYMPWQVDESRPIQVWWYDEGGLTSVAPGLEAMQEYRQRYMQNPASYIWAWGYYDFGIISISNLGNAAEVYVSASCGPVCGHGVRYVLFRAWPGKWVITGEELLWIS